HRVRRQAPHSTFGSPGSARRLRGRFPYVRPTRWILYRPGDDYLCRTVPVHPYCHTGHPSDRPHILGNLFLLAWHVEFPPAVAFLSGLLRGLCASFLD